MQKHLDWKRIGWTFIIPTIIISLASFVVFIPFLLGNWIAGNEIEKVCIDSFNLFLKWATGFGCILTPFLVFYICRRLLLLCITVVHFYYHNGIDPK
jgi:hypothetical protein